MRNIAVDAQLQPGGQMGGIETHLTALVRALGELDGPERYLLICSKEHRDWLRDYVGSNQQIVVAPSRITRRVARGLMGAAWPAVWGTGQRLWTELARRTGSEHVPPGWVCKSNGFFEALDVALVHVFYQKYVRTDVPTVFNPHDLQHEHFPQFFAPETLARRRYVYATACREASAVVAASRFTKEDVVKQYGITPDRVWTIPLAPATAAYRAITDDDCRETFRKYGLTQPFVFYPAATWEHKNHVRLLEAIELLRSRGQCVNLVCTGARLEPTWAKVRQFIARGALDDQVRFLGFVPSTDLRALYRLSQFVIAPSLFEQASGPMYEAWLEGVPVAASNVTSIPDQAGDAALLFDPFFVEAIAGAIDRMSTDAPLRKDLRRRGIRRLRDFSWERTAKAYRALYRHVAGWPMTEEDRFLLGWDWMSEPYRHVPDAVSECTGSGE